MKILLLNQVYYPDTVATAQYATDLTFFLRDRGHEVTVLCGQRDYDTRTLLYPLHENYKGIQIHRVSSTGFGKKSFCRRVVDSLTFDFVLMWKLLRLPKHDLVISFTSPPLIGVFGAFYCRIRGGRSVQWLMDINPDIAIEMGYLTKTAPLTRILTSLFELSLKWSSNIVVLDRWMKERAIAHGADGDRIAIVPPWPIQELKRPNRESSELGKAFRKKYGLENKFVILYSGNHSIVHPLDTLLGAAVRLKDDPGVAFVFIGAGERVKDVKETAEKNGLKNVVQLGYQPREMLPESLASANLHVVVLGNEVTGLVHTSKVYGVLATGCPYVFIGPKASHVADLLSECPYGFHVEHGEVDRLIDVIAKARGLSARQLGEIETRNFEHVLSHYSARKCLERFSDAVLGASEPQQKTGHAVAQTS